jgi:hypothetical protein
MKMATGWKYVSNDELNVVMDDARLTEDDVQSIIDELTRREPDPDVGMCGAGSPQWFRDRLRYMSRRLAKMRREQEARKSVA